MFTPIDEKYHLNRLFEVNPKKCYEVRCITGLGMLKEKEEL
jgi:hypothetical protein